jgi:hypothetical protein
MTMPWLWFRAHRGRQVVACAVVLSVLSVVLADLALPSLAGIDSHYAGVVFLTLSPVMSAVLGLGVVDSGMRQWERLGSRNLASAYTASAVLGLGIALLAVAPAALSASEPADLLRALARTVCTCFGLGIALSLVVDAVARSMLVSTFGIVSINLVTLGVCPGWSLSVLPGPQVGGSPMPSVALVVAGVLGLGLRTIGPGRTPGRSRTAPGGAG